MDAFTEQVWDLSKYYRRNYENLTADENGRVPDTTYEFAKKFFPGRPEHRLANAIKDGQRKTLVGDV